MAGDEIVGDVETSAAWDRARAAAAATAQTLATSAASPEALAEYVPERGRFLWRRAARMRQIGEVWRLGMLLLSPDGALYAQGLSTRAAERGRPGYQSASREVRRDLAAAALAGGFTVGTPVHFNARLLLAGANELPGAVFDPDRDSPEPSDASAAAVGAGTPAAAPDTPAAEKLLAAQESLLELPLGFTEGEVRVRWRAGAPLSGAQTLTAYLAERAELLLNPPFASE